MATTPSDRWLWLMGAGIILTTSAVYFTSLNYYWTWRLERIKSENEQRKTQESEADKVKLLEDSIPLSTLKRILSHQNNHIRTAAERILLSRYDRDPANAADLHARLASPDASAASEARTQAVNLMHLRESLNQAADPSLAAATHASFASANAAAPATHTSRASTPSPPLGSMHGFRELRLDEPSPFAADADSDAESADTRTGFPSPFLWRFGAWPPTLFHAVLTPTVLASGAARREALRSAPAAAWRLTPALRDSPWLASLDNVYRAAGLDGMDQEVLRDQMWVRALMVSMASDDPFDELNRTADASSDVEMTDAAGGQFAADDGQRRSQGSLFVEELEMN